MSLALSMPKSAGPGPGRHRDHGHGRILPPAVSPSSITCHRPFMKNWKSPWSIFCRNGNGPWRPPSPARGDSSRTGLPTCREHPKSFLGGVVAYSDAVKQKFLGVRAKTLAQHGAVSEAVAREMAGGARKRFGADFAIAVTGIAGPSGGSKSKPVGTVYHRAGGRGERRSSCANSILLGAKNLSRRRQIRP